MKFIYGTGNKAKVEQVKAFFKTQDLELNILSLKDIGFSEEIEENGETFEENSMIKAKAIKKYCEEKNIDEIIITDDAGLEVDALGGKPGVYSARYAGDHAPQEVVINKLLSELENVPEEQRTARFVCVITVVMPNGKTFAVRGQTNGKIPLKPGKMGKLTYNPVFIAEGFNKVMSEIPDKELGKTHREKAFLEAIRIIQKNG